MYSDGETVPLRRGHKDSHLFNRLDLFLFCDMTIYDKIMFLFI